MAEPVQNVHGGKFFAKVKAGAVGAGVAAIAIMIMMFVPLVPQTYEEEYQTMQTRTVSYQEAVDEEKLLFLAEDYTIPPDGSYRADAQIGMGQKVVFTVSASDNVNIYITTRSGIPIYSRAEVSSATYEFNAPIDDRYTFVVENTGGFFGLGAKSIGLFKASATVSWQEQETKYRDVTEPVTEKRMVTKNVTVIEMITGMVRVPSFG